MISADGSEIQPKQFLVERWILSYVFYHGFLMQSSIHVAVVFLLHLCMKCSECMEDLPVYHHVEVKTPIHSESLGRMYK